MERLLRLAVFLRTLDPKRFQFHEFVGKNWKGDPLLSCGTSACAIGWCPTVFPEVTMTKGDYWKCGGIPDFKVQGIEKSVCFDFRTNGQAALREFFGINAEEYDYLFIPGSSEEALAEDATADEVADRICNFVEGRRFNEI